MSECAVSERALSERGRPRSFDRLQALKQAMELFWRHGYGGVSLADLTAAMGIASPSLYAAFGSKDQLYREAVALYEASDGAELAKAIAATPTAKAAIETFLVQSAAFFTRPDRPAGCMVVLTVIHAAGASKATCDGLRDARTQAIEVFTSRLRRAVETGELPPSSDAAAIASFYVTVQQGMSLRARDGATRAELEAVANAAMAAWDGLTRSGAAQPVRASRPSSG